MFTAQITYPVVNGTRYSWVSIEVRIAGIVWTGVKSINYSRTRTRGIVKGTNPDPLGKTRGTNEYKADVELYLAEYDAIVQSIGSGYGDVLFDVFVSYSDPGGSVITDEIIGCSLDTTDASNTEGSDPTVRKVELNPIKIRFNGIDDNLTPLGV